MKTIQNLAGILLLSLSLNACAQAQTVQNNMQYNHVTETGNSSNRPVFYASSKYITQKLNAKDIKEVNLTSIALRITPTKKNEVSLRLPENFTQLVQTEVVNNKLSIRFKNHVEVHYDDIELILPYRYLEDLRIFGSGSMYLSKELNTDHLTVSIAGSGSFLAPSLECSQKLSMQVSGSGDISCTNISTESLEWTVNGSGNINSSQINSKECQITVAGSGDISCSKLQTEKCKISIAGSGDIRVSEIQTEELAGSVAGSGDLHLQGKARKADYHQAGSGTIHAEECATQDVTAKCIGNGEIYCRAEQTLDCETDQGGKVFYKGKPQVTTTSNNQPHRIK